MTIASIGLSLLAAYSGHAATPLPIDTTVQLDWSQPTQVYTIDLGTLPTRPWMVVEVTADPAHSTMALFVQATNWQFRTGHPGGCFSASDVFSNPGFGTVSLSTSLIQCDPNPGALAGDTVQVSISAFDFGFAGPPATVSINVHGETRPPTGTLTQQVDAPFVQQSIAIPVSKDTVLYEDTPTRSNGTGAFLWAGHKGSMYPFGHRHALLAFDVAAAIRPTSIVDWAELTVDVLGAFAGGGLVTLHEIAENPGSPWTEGDANPPGSEFDGAVSMGTAANWDYRSSMTAHWLEPGGDWIEPPLAQADVAGAGPLHISDGALTDAVQALVSNGSNGDGFVLRGPGSPSVNRGIQFASRENTSGAQTPVLQVLFTPTEFYESGKITTGVVNFINEGQNFRWIYDLDHDNIVVTDIGGVCEVTNSSIPNQLPYTYRYFGEPGHSRVDCCTWRIDSTSTGTVGTGQALFFHNLDANNPANMPPDGDLDGIRDLCDNCPSKANGPLRGTCLIGAMGAPCRSNQECGTGGRCNLSQQDLDEDFMGNVCEAPEPGVSAALAAGVASLAAWSKRRWRGASRSSLGALLGLVAALGTGSARAADPLPILAANVVLTSTATVRTYTIDLGTLPTRPALVVEVTPDGAHPNMQLQVEATNWQNGPGSPGVCPDAATSSVSSSGPGAVHFVSFAVLNCDPRPNAFAGATVDIRIRALNFGSASAPASVAVEIRGETRPPTGTLTQQVDTFLGQHQVTLPANKDTVLYEDLPTASNGAGEFLWSGEKVVLFPSTIESFRRSLLAFDVSAEITPVSVIDAAELRLGATSVVGGGGTVSLYRMATAPSSSWEEGNANPAGSEFDGAASTWVAATWPYRLATFLPWTNPGGDIVGSALTSVSITTTGSKTLSSPSLVAAVQAMATSGNDRDGFMLAGPSASLPTRAVQLASSESTTGVQRPELVVLFTPTEIYESGQIATGTKTFISEGQNFRWIYDLDHDDILLTNVGGVCEVVDVSSAQSLPYTYHFQGTPGFTGIDCCAWRVESPSTGTVGTGQALFFHNLDASNPANMPPDTDLDGIRNLCDNCANVPNGPLRGTCRVGPTPGAPCRTNQECGVGGLCSLSQEDANGDFVGDVCAPEPGFAVGLAAGLLLTAAHARQRRCR